MYISKFSVKELLLSLICLAFGLFMCLVVYRLGTGHLYLGIINLCINILPAFWGAGNFLLTSLEKGKYHE